MVYYTTLTTVPETETGAYMDIGKKGDNMEQFDFELITRNLKAMRVKCGYTQEDVARLMNVTTQTVRNYENQPQRLDLKKIVEFSKLYGCSPRVFFMD